MNAVHLGNGIVYFKDVFTFDNDYFSSFVERLHDTDRRHEQVVAKEDEAYVLTEGGYRITRNDADYAPRRFSKLTNLNQEDKKFIEEVRDAIHSCVVEYCKVFPIVIENIRWATNGYVIKYENGQSIGAHSDCNIAYAEDGVTPVNSFPMQNILTCGLFFNDDFEGGTVSYRPWGISVRPKPGSVLIYPSSYMGCHEVAAVTEGTRYAYLCWYGQGPINSSDHRMTDQIKKETGYETVNTNSAQRFVPVGAIKLS
jgi:predicted 2-oxoglutarate/Fe(II)-dependent dioxygenase YbiX